MKITIRLLSLISLLTLTISTACYAEKDPEAAARQALIDGDQAQVKIDQAQKRIEDAVDMDGVDATTIIGDQEEINEEGRRRIEALRKEKEAEGNN